MNTTRLLPKIAALTSSLTLAGGFVYVKAGGTIPGLPFNQQPAPAQPVVLSGSKSYSGTTTVNAGALPPESRPVLSGSKSLIISQPAQEPAAQTPVAQAPSPAVKPTVLPGWKSGVISVPVPNSATSSGGAPTPTELPTSARPIIPATNPAFQWQTTSGGLSPTQSVAPNSAPALPPHSPWPQSQQVDATKIKPKVLGGSKSAAVIDTGVVTPQPAPSPTPPLPRPAVLPGPKSSPFADRPLVGPQPTAPNAPLPSKPSPR